MIPPPLLSHVVLKMPLDLRTSNAREQQSDTWFIPQKKTLPGPKSQDQDSIFGKKQLCKTTGNASIPNNFNNSWQEIECVNRWKGCYSFVPYSSSDPTSMQMGFFYPAKLRSKCDGG